MENTAAVEPKAEKSDTPGIWTKQPVKKPGPKTENAQMEKTATVKEEPVKETASVNKKANEEKTNAESNSTEKVTVIADKKNPSKKATKMQTAKKKATTKKTTKKHTLCKLVKNDFLKKHFSEYKDLVANPEWICRKCGRVANEPKFLCKPILLSKIDYGDIIIS